MWIGAQARRLAQLMAEVLQAAGVEASLKKRAAVNTRRGVPLEVHEVARLLSLVARIRGAEEMIEAYFEQRRLRSISRDMTANAGVVLVLLVHHRHRVPANQRFDAVLQHSVAG